ncbi:MAG: metal-dependent transcriptional regulator [Lachnospiraceae bacterium]|nr:metal-dependent transcriptional regulator [Lachnospiraceae bacterium]
MNYPKHKSEESVQDYLETILLLSQKQPNVRAIDIARELNYSKPSVSVAMKNLKSKEYIEVSELGHISLTEEGMSIACSVLERHTVLSQWLIRMGVTPEVALEDACKMEHDMSDESFQAIKNYLNTHS